MKWRDFSSAAGGVQPMLRAGRLLAAAVLAAACSPVFNWREVPVGESLVAMLPCKPDRAERSLPMGAATVPNTPEAMHDWVAHTQQLKPGARMPAGEGRLPPAAIEDIAAWLGALK